LVEQAEQEMIGCDISRGRSIRLLFGSLKHIQGAAGQAMRSASVAFVIVHKIGTRRYDVETIQGTSGILLEVLT
jgi:hypothetical protein